MWMSNDNLVDEILEINKLVFTLEFFLSLNEADEVYNAIFDSGVSVKDLENLLKSYRDSGE